MKKLVFSFCLILLPCISNASLTYPVPDITTSDDNVYMYSSIYSQYVASNFIYGFDVYGYKDIDGIRYFSQHALHFSDLDTFWVPLLDNFRMHIDWDSYFESELVDGFRVVIKDPLCDTNYQAFIDLGQEQNYLDVGDMGLCTETNTLQMYDNGGVVLLPNSILSNIPATLTDISFILTVILVILFVALIGFVFNKLFTKKQWS